MVARHLSDLAYRGAGRSPAFRDIGKRAKEMPEDQVVAVREAYRRLREMPIIIDTRSRVTVPQIAVRVAQTKRDMRGRGVELGLVVIDHLDFVAASDRYRGMRTQEIGEIVLGLKDIARSQDVCVLLMSQLSREVEKRGQKERRPTLADLRNSGDLEQVADVVMFMYREEYYATRSVEYLAGDPVAFDAALAARGKLELILAKNRAGPTPTIHLFCDPASSSISSYERGAPVSDLPAPLVGADVDLSGLDGFLLDVQRLFASELWALSSGDEFKAAVALWGRAWQQTPPGSLPNDERVLAAFSGAGKDWKKVRTMALRGFVECSDGRLYHKVLCDDVLRAHRKRQAFRERTKNATEARRQRNDQRDDQRNDDRDDGSGGQRNVVDDEHVTSVQGRGRRSRQSSSSLRSEDAGAARAAFDAEFWPKYPNKVGKLPAAKAFEKLFREMGGVVAPILCGLECYCRDKPVDRPWLNPATFLNQRRFEDQPASSSATATPSGSTIKLGPGVEWPEPNVIAAVDRWKADPTTWPDRIGPPPGTVGCRVPEHLIREAA